MKQRKIVLMVGALFIIISAVALIMGCSHQNNQNNQSSPISINGVWMSMTPPSQSDLEEGLTNAYLVFDGQMHYYVYLKRGVLYKGHSCAYSINGDSVILASGAGNVHKFSINNNVLTIGAYQGSWMKVNSPTLEEVRNAPHGG